MLGEEEILKYLEEAHRVSDSHCTIMARLRLFVFSFFFSFSSGCDKVCTWRTCISFQEMQVVQEKKLM